MKNKKYILTDETIKLGEKRLYRIKAIKNFFDVKEGDLGGFIESEKNLSHDGKAWVGVSAKVFGDAKVYHNAQVFGYAQVFGDAKVYHNANVFTCAKVSGNAEVFGDAEVSGDAQVFGSAKVFDAAKVSGDAKVFDNAWV